MSPHPADLAAAMESVLREIPDPSSSLPDPVLRFVLKVTPMINVDLLVRNAKGENLLAWRVDAYDKGWHIPGGIIRFNERAETRIDAVAKRELAATVRHGDQPVEVRQFFHPRGHFISLLYLCEIEEQWAGESMYHAEGPPRAGQLKWIRGVPPDLYGVHGAYAQWLNGRT